MVSEYNRALAMRMRTDTCRPASADKSSMPFPETAWQRWSPSSTSQLSISKPGNSGTGAGGVPGGFTSATLIHPPGSVSKLSSNRSP